MLQKISDCRDWGSLLAPSPSFVFCFDTNTVKDLSLKEYNDAFIKDNSSRPEQVTKRLTHNLYIYSIFIVTWAITLT